MGTKLFCLLRLFDCDAIHLLKLFDALLLPELCFSGYSNFLWGEGTERSVNCLEIQQALEAAYFKLAVNWLSCNNIFSFVL